MRASKDYLLQIKIKNAPMMRIMKANNIETASALGRVTGLSPSVIGEYLNLKMPPINIRGEWRTAVLTMAKSLRVPPEMLFPEQHLTKALKRNKIEGEVTFVEMGKFISQTGRNYLSEMVEKDNEDTQDELLDILEKGLKKLPTRERKVLEKRYRINQKEEEVLSKDFKEVNLMQFPYSVKEKTIKKPKQKTGDLRSLKSVGDDFSVSTERIRQIESKAFRKLRKYTKWELGNNINIQKSTEKG